MRKKITVVLALILLVALLTTLFVGCDEIFKKNDKRDATQVVATVSYKGKTADVYKFELTSSFNNYAYYYTYYYGMTYEQAADYVLKSLAQQKLLALYAEDRVAEMMGVASHNSVSDLLSPAEIDHAIKEVNKSLLSSLKTIVSEAISEDNYNSGAKDDEEEVAEFDKTKDSLYIKFMSNGGSDVERLQINVGQKATKPADPTYAGYTFYGWFYDKELTHEVDFKNDVFNQTTVLYAKWVKYVEPRSAKEKVEDEDDYDPDDETITMANLSDKFFTEAYQNTLYDEFVDEDFVKDMMVAEGSSAEKVLKEYISEGVATLKKNMTSNLFKDSHEECYEYYLQNEYQTLIIEKLKRLIGESVEVTEAEIEEEFNRLVANNKESFANNDSAYSSALSSNLATTYYHPNIIDKDGDAVQDQDSYGFVINLLMKLSDEDIEELTDMLKENPANKEAVIIERNRMISDMQVYVSNPSYYNNDDKDDVDYALDEGVEIKDPMTDPLNKFNDIDSIDAEGNITYKTDYDHSFEVKISDTQYNDYNNIISFELVDGKYAIKYNATEAPTMAYLLNKCYAFDQDLDNDSTYEVVGIIHQIQNTFAQVTAAVAAGDLTKVEGVYWLRKVATEWLYLIGDDSGSFSKDSNNNGLGYLVTPEGETSSFLEDFTTYARDLINEGTGAYCTSALTDADFKGADEDGIIAGNFKGFVVADSFIESGSTSSGYAGIFVLLASNQVWNNDSTTIIENADGTYTEQPVALDITTGILSKDYVMTYAEELKDVKTIHQTIYDSLFEGKKTDAYNLEVNTMGNQYAKDIKYYNDVYKSLWKDLDKQ